MTQEDLDFVNNEIKDAFKKADNKRLTGIEFEEGDDGKVIVTYSYDKHYRPGYLK